MWLLFKYMLKNSMEKKFRAFLVMFSIMISCALFFASNAISGSIISIYTDQLKKDFGTSDIIITQGNEPSYKYMLQEGANLIKDRTNYIIGAVNGFATYKYKRDEIVNVSVHGIDLTDLQTMNSFSLFDESNLYPFKGSKVIISKMTSEKYGLKTGDYLELYFNNIKHRFLVSGISYPTGLFLEDGQTAYAVIPKETAAAINSAEGKANIIYIKLKNQSEINNTIKILMPIYKHFSVKEPVSPEEIAQQVSPMSTSFLLITVIVFFISIFIIYTTFKVITAERLPIVGTFRSIGATKKMTGLILMLESLLYGVIGGVFGCALGVLILKLMTKSLVPSWAKGSVKAVTQYTSAQIATAFLVAILLCVISSFIPIRKVSKLPIKDIIFNTIQVRTGWKGLKLLLGLTFISFAILIPPIIPKQSAILFDALCLFLSISAVILLIPYATAIFIQLLSRVYIFIFGNLGILAVKNLKDNKNILSNISLLSIGISSLLMINTVSFSVLTEISSSFTKNSYSDIYLSAQQADKSFERLLYSIEGVSDIYGYHSAFYADIAGMNEKIGVVDGVVKSKLLDYWKMEITNSSMTLEKLDSGRYILLSEIFKDKLMLKVGDVITLKLKKGNCKYEVLGFFNTSFYGGSYALVSERNLKADMDTPYYSNFYIKTSIEPAKVTEAIKKQFGRRIDQIYTMKELEKTKLDMNEKLFSLLKGFSIMTLIIGILGVFNNLIMAFIERKHYLAILRSVGMSKRQIIKMVFIEALTGGIVGGIFGILTGILLVMIMSYVLKAMSFSIPLIITPSLLLNSILSAIAIMLVASISPALKSSKLNIIKSLKYE